MDHASAVYAAMSGEACKTSASANTMYTTPSNIDLGARAALEAAGQMESQISGQGGDGEQSTTVGGGAWQHTTGTSKEMTQKGPDIALADEGPQIPSASTHLNDTLDNNLPNNGQGARTEDDAAVAMEGEIMSQWEEWEHNRMAGGGAGQHTSGASEKSTLRGNSFRFRAQELPRYKAGRGRTKVNDPTSTSGTPAAAATQPTPESVGSKRPTPDWP